MLENILVFLNCLTKTFYNKFLITLTDRLRLTDVEKVNTKREKEKTDTKRHTLPNEVSDDTRQKKKNKNKFADTPEDRVQKDLQKVMLLQARMAKKNRKPKRIRTVMDDKFGVKNGMTLYISQADPLFDIYAEERWKEVRFRIIISFEISKICKIMGLLFYRY